MPRIEFPVFNGGQSLPDCAATGRKCSKPECLTDQGTYCSAQVGYISSLAIDSEFSKDKLKKKIKSTAQLLQVDPKVLNNTIKNFTGR